MFRRWFARDSRTIQRRTTPGARWTRLSARALRLAATMVVPLGLVLLPAIDVRATGPCGGPSAAVGTSPLQYEGGHVLQYPYVYAIFLESGSGPATQPTDQLGQFTAELGNTPFSDVLSQYGMFPTMAFQGARTFNTDGPLNDGYIRDISSLLVSDPVNPLKLPPQGSDLLLVYFVDDAVGFDDPTVGSLCTNITGYHGTGSTKYGPSTILNPPLAYTYAVVGSLSDSCMNSLQVGVPAGWVDPALHQVDRQTIAASHEIAEAITDPFFGQTGLQAWVFPGVNGTKDQEIADFCKWSYAPVQIDGKSNRWWVQPIYDLNLDKITNGGVSCAAVEPNPIASPACYGSTSPSPGCGAASSMAAKNLPGSASE